MPIALTLWTYEDYEVNICTQEEDCDFKQME